MNIVKKSDWKTIPLPEKRVKVTFERTFSNEESDRLKAGLIPEEMEDKWFIYFENETLFFHRSWTGYCIYQVRFAQDENGFRAVSVEINRDPEQYLGNDDKHDLWSLNNLIDTQLL